jgi:hypothetical protein
MIPKSIEKELAIPSDKIDLEAEIDSALSISENKSELKKKFPLIFRKTKTYYKELYRKYKDIEKQNEKTIETKNYIKIKFPRNLKIMLLPFLSKEELKEYLNELFKHYTDISHIQYVVNLIKSKG